MSGEFGTIYERGRYSDWVIDRTYSVEYITSIFMQMTHVSEAGRVVEYDGRYYVWLLEGDTPDTVKLKGDIPRPVRQECTPMTYQR
jgi:hypothetical protein